MSNWTNPIAAGLLPEIILASDPRPVAEQIAERYAHGGGWRPSGKGQWQIENVDAAAGQMLLNYPDDPPMREVSRAEVNGELCVLFQRGWLAIFDNATLYFDVVRMD